MKRQFFFWLFVFLALARAGAQTPVIDSLKGLLRSAPQQADTTTQRRYIRVTEEYLKTNLDSAQVWGQKTLAFAAASADERLVAEAAYKMAEVYIRLSKPSQAIEHAQRSKEGYQALGDTLLMLKASNAIGGAYIQMGKLAEAMAEFYTSKRVAERLGDRRLLLAISTNIALVENMQGHHQAAIELFLEALEYGRQIDEPQKRMSCLNGLANSYYSLEEFELSIKWRKELIELAEKTGDKRMRCKALGNLAQTYFQQKKYEIALSTARQSEELMLELGSHSDLGNHYLLMGNLLREKGQYDQAIEAFEKSSELFSKQPDYDNMAYDHLRISEIHEKLGRPDLALRYYKRYHELKDSTGHLEAAKKISELKAQFDVEKKEAENRQLTVRNETLAHSRNIFVGMAAVLLALFVTLFVYSWKNRQQKEEIERQRNELKENAAIKDRLFTIVAHDLRTPLISLGGLAKKVNFLLQRNRMEEVQLLGETVEAAVGTVHQLLDNLLAWAMVQGGRFPHEPEDMDVEAPIRQAVELYRNKAESKQVALVLASPLSGRIRCDRNAFSTILRNLLDNAVKFTPPNGQVTVEQEQVQGTSLVRVKNTGPAIPAEELEKLFCLSGKKGAKGTAGEQGTGLGLALCRELVEMNEGRIEVTSREGIGTVFTVALPAVA